LVRRKAWEDHDKAEEEEYEERQRKAEEEEKAKEEEEDNPDSARRFLADDADGETKEKSKDWSDWDDNMKDSDKEAWNARK